MLFDKNKIKIERKSRKMSYAQFADFLRPWAPLTRKQTIWYWEVKGREPIGRMMFALSMACEKPVSYFFKNVSTAKKNSVKSSKSITA